MRLLLVLVRTACLVLLIGFVVLWIHEPKTAAESVRSVALASMRLTKYVLQLVGSGLEAIAAA